MKTPQRHKKGKYIAIGTIVIVVILLCIFSYFYALENNHKINNDSTKSKAVVSNSTNTTNTTSSTNTTFKESGTDKPNEPTAIEGSNLKAVQVAITSTNQIDSTIQIRTIIYAIDSGGTCTIKLERTGYNTITQSSDLQNLANTSTCKGFNLPISSVATGDWNMTVSYLSTKLTGSTSQTLTVK